MALNLLTLRRLFYDYFGVLLFKIVAAFLGLAVNWSIANFLSESEAGKFFLCISFVSVAVIFCRLGLEHIFIREIALAHERQDGRELIRLTSALFAIVSFAIFISFFIFFAVSKVFNFPFLEGGLGSMERLILWIAPISISWLVSFLLQGMGMYNLLNIFQGALVSFLFLIFVWFNSSFLINDFSFTFLFYGYSFVSFLSAFIAMGYAFKVLRDKVAGNYIFSPDFSKFKGFLTTFLFQLSRVVSLHFCIIFVGLSFSSSEGAIFTVSFQLALSLSLILITVNSILIPKASGICLHGGTAELKTLMLNSTAFSVVMSLPLIVVLFSFSDSILEFFGASYIRGEEIFRVLLFAQLFNAIGGSAGGLIIASGFRLDALIGSAIGLLFLVASTALLVPQFDILGVAFAFSISVFLTNLYYNFVVYKKFGFFPLGLVFSSRRSLLYARE